MIDEVTQTMKESAAKSKEALRGMLARLRTGRASASLLDTVRVDYYGVKTLLNQMATISTPEPRLLLVKPFDRTQVSEIEKAILAADLGLNPNSDGEIIRIPVPPLTEERRNDMVKLARKQGEEGKISIRNHRRDCNSLLKSLESDGDASKDEGARALKVIQEITDQAISDVDKMVEEKTVEIIEI